MRKRLWGLGYRYRLHVKILPGKPDIVLRRHGIVIFIDGGFWHGHNWSKRKEQIKSNRDYWVPKIERNIERDAINNRMLEEMGFTVLRFWDHDVQTSLDQCIAQVVEAIEKNDLES